MNHSLMRFLFGTAGARRLQRRPRDSLDQALLNWSEHDVLNMRTLLDGGCLVLGRSGSGKTSSSGKALGHAIVKYPGSGGLILGASPTDLEMWKAILAAEGRLDDLICFGPKHKHQFNVIDYLMRLGYDSREIAKAIITIGESLDNDDSRTGGGDTDKFWPIQSKITIETGVEILKQTDRRVHLPSLQKFIITAAQSSAALKTEEFKTNFHGQCFAKLFDKERTRIEEHEFERAWNRWIVQWPEMNTRTRTSIEAGVTGILDVFSQGIVRSLICEETTITPAAMDEGKWLFGDMSVGQYGSSGAFVLNALKYATQCHVRSRMPGQWKNVIGIWADEAAKIVNSQDSFYLTESRKYGGFTVFLAQSMQSFHAALAGERGRSQAEVLLGSFSTKVAHAIGDPGTAEWLSSILGNEVKLRLNVTAPDEKPMGEEIFSSGGGNAGWGEQVEPCLEPRHFMHGLKTGGKLNGNIAEAIVLRSGQLFSNGQSYLRVAFQQ